MASADRNPISLTNRGTVVILAIALALRFLAVWAFFPHLENDPDHYGQLAQGLVDGKGFVDPGSSEPTAFRPPLYPFMIAAMRMSGGGPWTLGVLQAICGTLTVLIVLQLAQSLCLGRGGRLAAVIVAVDPLLVYYTPRVMTETVFTFLVAALCWAIVRASEPSDAVPPKRFFSIALIGVTFGIAALCRPTIWAFALVMVTIWVWRRVVARTRLPVPVAVGFVSVLVVAPWIIRNQFVFGRPIVTTTHGGYTLLLGNNPVFYREVVAAPWGTVWSGPSLDAWQTRLEERIAEDLKEDHRDELLRDKWMKRRAWATIRQSPATFMEACVQRIARLWNVAPLGDATIPLHNAVRGAAERFGFSDPTATAHLVRRIVTVAIAGSYSFLFASALAGCVLCRGPKYRSLKVVILSLTLLHAVYWANARMRAPAMPAVAILAVAAWVKRPPKS